jgi:hypothetical protein
MLNHSKFWSLHWFLRKPPIFFAENCRKLPKIVIILNILKSFIFLGLYTMTIHIKFWQQHCNVSRPKNLIPWRDSNPGFFCSGGGRDDHYATPPPVIEMFVTLEQVMFAQGSMLCSRFSAILTNFLRKNCVFLEDKC